MAVGIYKIVNLSNGKVYIGSSTQIAGRWSTHLDALLHKKHHSSRLQQEFNKFGYKNFSFQIIELCNPKIDKLDLHQKEVDYIVAHDSINVKMGYNMSLPIKPTNTVLYAGNCTEAIEITNKDKQLIAKNIVMPSIEKIYNRYKQKESVSINWINKNENNLKQFLSDINNVASNMWKARIKDIYWTANSKVSQKLHVSGCTSKKNWTNAETLPLIEKRNYLIFAHNVFLNSFLCRNIGIETNHDQYAIDLLIQWIVSVSDITKPIHIYIPSKRMRTLLQNWIDAEE